MDGHHGPRSYRVRFCADLASTHGASGAVRALGRADIRRGSSTTRPYGVSWMDALTDRWPADGDLEVADAGYFLVSRRAGSTNAGITLRSPPKNRRAVEPTRPHRFR
jgi:hypothetical protein